LISIVALPVIVRQPLSATYKINSSDKCALEIFSTGIGHIQYKWEKYHFSSNIWIRPSHRAVNITSPKLIFGVITEEDEGVYHCLVSNHDGNVASNSATITLYGEFHFTKLLLIFNLHKGPPTIQHISNNTVTVEGNKTTLMCSATNDKDAVILLTIVWYNSKGEQLKSNDDRLLIYNTNDPFSGQVQSVLLFDPVNHTDSGEYTCHAFNDDDCYTELSTNLIVECKI